MASLYEIDSNIKSILDSVLDQTDENGEFTGDIESIYDSLNELQEAREAKMENIALYAKNLSAEALAIKNEEKIYSQTAGSD